MSNYIKTWAEMTSAERQIERALPKPERQQRALMRNLSKPVEPKRGRLVKSKRGTWGRILTTGCRAGYVAAISAAECETLGLVPGRGNY